MRIVNLQAENFKKLVAIDITPTEDMIVITGGNGAGKSSILDAITAALCGGKAIDPMPIRKGQEKGAVKIDCGEFTVTRTFTKSGTYLKIESNDGHEVGSPQKFLDQIIGQISFDPLHFINEEKDKQKRVLMDLLGIDVDALDQEEKTLREERTIIGREVKRQEGVVKTIKWHPDVKDSREVSVTEITAKIQEAMDHNANIEEKQRYGQNLKERGKKAQERIADMKAEIAELEVAVEAAKAEYRQIMLDLEKEVMIDIESMKAEAAGVEERNKLIRENVMYLKAKQGLTDEQKRYEEMSKKIGEIEKKRKELLDGAPMPVEGLSFDQGGILYNGVPLEQASDGEKLMIGLGISMALNPMMRVLRIKDGSLLDQKNREIIRKALKDKDYQLWFESVGTDGKVGILIEEGEIVG